VITNGLHSEKIGSVRVVLYFLFGFFLHMQKTIGGLNFSVSDIVVIFLFLDLLFIKRKFVIPKPFIVALLVFLVIQMINSFFFVATEYAVNVSSYTVIYGFIKFAVTLLYFFYGLQHINARAVRLIFHGFVMSGVVSSIVGVATLNKRLPILNEIFSFDFGIRYVGLMNDANYLAVLLACTLPLVQSNYLYKNRLLKLILSLLIMGGIVLTGSKTGLVLIFVYHGISFLLSQMALGKRLLLFVFVLGVGLTMLLYQNQILDFLSQNLANGDRIAALFTDDDALSGSGSFRLPAWLVSVDLIKTFPLFGAGIGTYQSVALLITQSDLLAHNTYLQIVAEWGLPIGLFFFGYMGWVFVKAKVDPAIKRFFFVLLLGFLSLSLNNARIFWFMLALFQANCLSKVTVKETLRQLKPQFSKKEVL
jgi:hypothetical protein